MCSPKRCVVSSAATGRVGRPLEPGDEVGQHGARLHGGELVGVTDQHQPGVGPHRLEQPRHHRQRHHRGLVDHDDVVGQPVGAVVPEPHPAVGSPAEQAVQGRGAQSGQPLLVGRVLEGAVVGVDRLLHGLLEPGGRLAGRCGQGDARRSARGELVLLRDQREQAGDRGGLAGARAAGEHRRPPRRGGARGIALLGVTGTREDPFQPGVERGGVDLGRPTPDPRDEVVADLTLLAPVAIEVEARPTRRTISSRTSGLRPTRSTQAAGSGHGSGASCSSGRSAIVARSRQTDPVRTARTARAVASSTCSSDSSSSTPSRTATWMSAALSSSGRLNRASSSGRAERAPAVVGVGPHGLVGDRHDALPVETVASRPSSRSESSTTIAAGGCQLKTPHGTPSTSGVSGPHMPRT